MTRPPPIRFTLGDVNYARERWGATCGPVALAAVLDWTPREVRPFMGDFETKGYTNPTLMRAALKSIGVRFRWHVTHFFEPMSIGLEWPSFGLARVQWAGPWTAPHVPPAARYRYTHWIGVAKIADAWNVFDVNAMTEACTHEWNGWAKAEDWERVVVPEIVSDIPRADGKWWITHSIEVHR